MSRPDLLEDDVRAAAPRPDATFVNRLDAEAAAGFPRRRKAPAAKRSWLASLRPPQLIGGLCALLLLVGIGGVVVTSGRDGGGDVSSTAAPADVSRESGDVPPPSSPSSAAEPSAVGSGGDPAAGERDRRVERSADLEVAVPFSEFDDANAQVLAIAGRAGAIVDTSEISREGDEGEADYTLRVPVQRLSATLADLSALGRLEARDEAGFDVTGAFVSARDRAGDLRAERASLRRQLAAEADPAAAEELRRRLDAVGRELANARAAVAELRQRTSYATVALTLRTGDEAAGASEDEGGLTPGAALDAAGGALTAVSAVAILVLAIGGPIALVALTLAATVRALRRRRRERVLGAAAS